MSSIYDSSCYGAGKTMSAAQLIEMLQYRVDAAEAQLALVDEYGRYCHDSARPGDEQLPWPYTSFADWLAQQSEPRP